MTEYALLNNVAHQDLKVITERSARYGDDVMYCMTFPFEFRSVQASYPILMQQDSNGSLYPVALLGFQEKENLFLGESGWKTNYVPAMIRREPFVVGFQNSSKEGEDKTTRMLSIDMAHPRVSIDAGEPLFQPLGGRTPFLESSADLLETIYVGTEHVRGFMAALKEYGLTEAITIEIPLIDGSRNQLIGFHGLVEEKIQELDGATLESFSKNGYLMPLFMMLASFVNIQKLVELKNKTVGKQ